MYYMNHDAVDYFRVDFTPDESIVGGKYYPLGTFAAEALECGWNVSGEIHRRLKRFSGGVPGFPGGQRSIQCGYGAPCHRQLWKVLEELPLYNKLLAGGSPDVRADSLSAQTPGHPG